MKIGIIGSGHNAVAISAAVQVIAAAGCEVEILEAPPTSMVFEIRPCPADCDPRGFINKNHRDWKQPRRRNNYKSRRRN